LSTENQPLNMRMRVWYLHCPEAGLCCYLVIHIENVLRPLQLFYFHLVNLILPRTTARFHLGTCSPQMTEI
jgi:hypothetical protein